MLSHLIFDGRLIGSTMAPSGRAISDVLHRSIAVLRCSPLFVHNISSYCTNQDPAHGVTVERNNPVSTHHPLAVTLNHSTSLGPFSLTGIRGEMGGGNVVMEAKLTAVNHKPRSQIDVALGLSR